MTRGGAMAAAVASIAASLAASFAAFVATLVAAVPAIAGDEDAPRFEWSVATPESRGLSSGVLERMRDDLARRGTKALLVIRGDAIVCEWYAEGQGRDVKHYTASLAKAIVGGVTLAVARSDGLIDPDDPAWKHVPAWRDDPLRSKITIRHLATHTSGIEDAEEGELPHEKLSGWKGRFWMRDPNPFTIARDEAPVVFAPGSRFAYSNPGIAMLGYAVTASLRGAPERDLRTVLRERILRPIGAADGEWSMGYGATYETDGLPLQASWGGGAFSPDAVARIARLFLRRGDWQGRRLLRREPVEEALRDAGGPTPDRGPPEGPFPRSGLAWYVNSDGSWPRLPRDAFAGAGAGNQMLLVVPGFDLIAVRFGGQIERGDFWGGAERHLFIPLMQALAEGGAAPYPESAAIGAVRFAPLDTIRRMSIGCDNWPIAWADDGELIASYGDGQGFEPRVERKLSLGLARIIGPPESAIGENLRAPTIEREGDGARGPKASGIIMVDGVLWLWARNTANATLVSSRDRGKTWTWGWTLAESFGCPTFLQLGRDGEGAFDEHVYTLSPDGPSAYESYDHIVLARAPRRRLGERERWEFYAGTDASDEPRWSPRIEDRAPVFTSPGRCHRPDAVFHPRLGRVLLLLAHDHAGGWGIYDAPRPWGPWSTAFHTTRWDAGDTHGYRLPAKWIDGASDAAWLVYSGLGREDAFCLRRMEIVGR